MKNQQKSEGASNYIQYMAILLSIIAFGISIAALRSATSVHRELDLDVVPKIYRSDPELHSANEILKIDLLHKELMAEVLRVKQETLRMLQNWWWGFLVITTAILAVPGMSFYNMARKRILDKANLRLEEHHKTITGQLSIKDAEFSQLKVDTVAFITSSVYGELGYDKFLEFEPIVQKKLNHVADKRCKKICNEERDRALASIDQAIRLAKEGNRYIDKMKDQDRQKYLEKPHYLIAYINCLNTDLYSKTARFVIEGAQPSEKDLNKMIELAEKLVKFALQDNIRVSYYWWEALETSVFFYSHIGRLSDEADLIEKAKENYKLLRTGGEDLIKTPEEFVQLAEEEYVGRGFISL